eukprot:GHVP01033285.1.p2 GENE.GHVP01033285.1~~GHVP01033285.1.p2  ORF type:complete len:169 (-),score=43.72 GHVP01033285.1:133-639(-)
MEKMGHPYRLSEDFSFVTIEVYDDEEEEWKSVPGLPTDDGDFLDDPVEIYWQKTVLNSPPFEKKPKKIQKLLEVKEMERRVSCLAYNSQLAFSNNKIESQLESSNNKIESSSDSQPEESPPPAKLTTAEKFISNNNATSLGLETPKITPISDTRNPESSSWWIKQQRT